MYKLFLCLRYLRSRIIAYFAVLAVALCVAMMLIVISVMNGFLDKIEQAAKGLFGDVVVDAASLSGVARYDEFIAEVTAKVPEVEACSPFILTMGILSDTLGADYRRLVQIAGIRLPDQAKVTEFAKGLHFQRDTTEPTFDPPFDRLLAALREETAATQKILDRKRKEIIPGEPTDPDLMKLVFSLRGAIDTWQRWAARTLETAIPHQQPLREIQDKLTAAYAESGGEMTYEIERMEEKLDDLRGQSGVMEPSGRMILGLGIPALSSRTPEGETVRYVVPGSKMELLLAPLGRRWSTTEISPSRGVFTIIDDCKTDVSTIDREMVYIPFETLQRLNNMAVEYDAETNEVSTPARCSQIQIKVKPEHANGRKLQAVADKINRLWGDFETRYPDVAGSNVQATTWRERQRRIIAPIQQQRTLVVTMFGIISLVSVVLIFVIFYTIVVQKTRDIGVLKTVGASSGGVAQIFLAYGAMIGLVGAILGCVGGYYFVRYINPIQDAIDYWFGFRVWSKEWFLFEKIPNEVELLPAVLIMIGAVLAGLVGAILPAIRAARMQPVEALRYE